MGTCTDVNPILWVVVILVASIMSNSAWIAVKDAWRGRR